MSYCNHNYFKCSNNIIIGTFLKKNKFFKNALLSN